MRSVLEKHPLEGPFYEGLFVKRFCATENFQPVHCMHCAERLGQQFAMFMDWTNSVLAESKLKPLEWLLVIGLWQLKLNATEIAAAADIQARTAQRCINLLGSSHGAQSEVDTFDVLLDAIK